MARTLSEIEAGIITAITSDTRLEGLNNTSKASIWRLLVNIFASCIFVLESIYDLHRLEMLNLLRLQKAHRASWYKTKALAFQFGHDLVTDSDVYDNTGYSEEEIAASKIIKYSAVEELEGESRLLVKIATEVGGVRQPANLIQRAAFKAYIKEIKDAGVNVTDINYLPDRLYLAIQIYYDPLVLDDQGYSILSGGKPVEAAILEYMKELPFNGELVLAHLVDKLQKVNGVAIPHLTHAETSWIDGDTNDYGQIRTIDVKRIPESGYFEVVNFNNITYISNV